MQIQKFPIAQQAHGEFNGGEIVENKPVGFPQDGGRMRPYSNLFYWAHAKGMADSTIGLHPHQGFEIMSFVLKGNIRHYDTKMRAWKPLQAGDVQIIRAGKGISHSEFLAKDSAIFQIWFDPDLRKTLQQEASYDDYAHADLPMTTLANGSLKTYIGEGSPFQLDTPDVEIYQLQLNSGEYNQVVGESKILSVYVLSGTATINGENSEKDDFLVIRDTTTLEVAKAEAAELFVIASPALLNYRTYAKSIY